MYIPVLWDPYYNVLQFKFNSKFLTTPTSKFNDELDSSFFFPKNFDFFFFPFYFMEFYMRTLSALHLHLSQDTQKSDRASDKNNLQIREKKEKEMEVLNNYMESASVLRICWCTGFRKATPTAVVTFSFFLSPSSSSSHLTLKARQKKMEQCCLKVLPLYVRLFSSF